MKDFDADFAARAGKDDGFILGGHRFKVNPGVHPSVLINFESADAFSQEETQKAIDDAVKAFLTSQDDCAKWDELRARTEDPVVTYAHMRAVMIYLYEVEAEIPTLAPVRSLSSRASASPSSAPETSSPEATGS